VTPSSAFVTSVGSGPRTEEAGTVLCLSNCSCPGRRVAQAGLLVNFLQQTRTQHLCEPFQEL